MAKAKSKEISGEFIYWATCSPLIWRLCFDQGDELARVGKQYLEIKKARARIQKLYSSFIETKSYSDSEREAVVMWLNEYLNDKVK